MAFRVKSITSFGDLKGLLVIHDATWDKSTGILDLLRSSTSCYLVVDDSEKVCAYAFIEVDAGAGGFAELNDIAVDPEYRGRGLGRLLMQRIMHDFGWVKLLASASKPELLDFYKDMGFHQEGVFENYYGVDEDAIRFSWKKSNA
ncbi:MAG: GNAT family N-acetyltransferase [Candidatus Aminicenantes bacterium]|nr:GNAT family N-acetyltransferase [Candidatus Aminicenantes bacterium]